MATDLLWRLILKRKDAGIEAYAEEEYHPQPPRLGDVVDVRDGSGAAVRAVIRYARQEAGDTSLYIVGAEEI